MRRTYTHIISLGIIGSILLFAACQKQSSPLIPSTDEYRSWEKATDETLNYPVPGHGDHFRIIYINSLGFSVQPIQKNSRRVYNYPEGTIIVKEIYSGKTPPQQGKTPISITVMIKNTAHPKSQGGWLWIERTESSQQEHIIDYKLCIECHTNANEPHPYGDKNPNNDDRDYVFFPPSHTLSSGNLHLDEYPKRVRTKSFSY